MKETIQAHGGTLINRIVSADHKTALEEKAKSLNQIKINAWAVSDLDLIGVGAFFHRLPDSWQRRITTLSWNPCA